MRRDPEVLLREAVEEVRQYLGDLKAPALVADSMHVLASGPPEVLAAELRSWALGQQKRRSSTPFVDLLFVAVKRIQVFEELGVLPGDGFRRFLDRLAAVLLGGLAGEERGRFAACLVQLRDIDVDGAEGVGASVPRPSAAPGAGVGGDASGGPRAATHAGGALEAGLAAQRQEGSDAWSETGAFRALARSVPDPRTSGADSPARPPTSAPIEALHRLVAHEQDRQKANLRWAQMVAEAVDHFNQGAIARSVTLLELAARLQSEGEVDPESAEKVRATAHDRLSRDRLLEAALDVTRRPMLRKLLDHFPGLSAHRLIDQLSVEADRHARRYLLALLEAGGAAARPLLIQRLEVTYVGPVRAVDSWHLQRNLLYLLNRVPRPADADLDWELRIVSVLTAPHLPVQLVREAIQFVGGIPLPGAGAHLVQRMREVEKILVDGKEGIQPVPQLWRLANSIASALARCGTSDARMALVEHALSFHPRLGDTASRLADLAGADLRGQPEVAAALLDSLRILAPMRMLGVMSTRNEKALVAIVRALAATRTPEVRKALEEIAARYADREFGRIAHQATHSEIELAPLPGSGTAADPGAALNGDLRVFGLPNLLQSLQQSRATGQLHLRGENGNVYAVFRLDRGRLSGCVAGGLSGDDAFYQAFQQPSAGKFEFLREAPGAQESGQDLTLLLLEAVRRDDDFRQARRLVADDAFVRATGRRPTAPPDEADGGLVRMLWTRVRDGAAVVECELAAKRDSWTVRRLLAHWVREGAAEVSSGRDAERH
ncbi:MAG: DUF4388 domain-containing protein [Thermoanaerobaculia bacterium]|nr:MAG: DUF4388 domain-containing protein [Thermoanaerobaculia bacterium]